MANAGPASLVLMATIARKHYLQGHSNVRIADDVGLSRFKVARMLDAAREQGLVRVEIAPCEGLDLEASAQLQERWSLQHCAVLAAHGLPGADLRAALGGQAAKLLAEILADGDVLGLPLSRSVQAMVQQLGDLPRVDVVQLTGAIELPSMSATAVDLVKTTAGISGGTAMTFYAPFALDTAEAAVAMTRQPPVQQGLSAISGVTHAVVGIGAWTTGESTIHAVATPKERADAATAGVVGEAAGVLFDADGVPVPTGVGDRLITLSAAALHDIPEVIGIAMGASRAESVRAAMRGGLLDGLVVDTALAHALLAA